MLPAVLLGRAVVGGRHAAAGVAVLGHGARPVLLALLGVVQLAIPCLLVVR